MPSAIREETDAYGQLLLAALEGREAIEQAWHNGDISRAVEAGTLVRDDVVERGRILAGEQEGRTADDEITVFDSTGLAVQDLAVAALVYERWRADPTAEEFADVSEVDLG